MAECSIAGCARPRKSRGWCTTHYERWRVHGDPTHETWTKVCTVTGCEKPHKASGLCLMHWTRWNRTGDVGSVGATRVLRYAPGTQCGVDGCERGAARRGYCDNHYRAAERHGDPTINLCPKAERVADCIVCGKRTAHGLRRFCSTACRAFVARAGVTSQDRCRTCGDALPVVLTASGLRKRGNGHGLCLACADAAPCVQCGGERARGGAGKLVCRPCKRPQAQRDALLRRARKVDAVCEHGPGCVTTSVIVGIRRDACFYCGDPAEHADHFEPLAHGGKHCHDNLVPACAPCNLAKSDREPWSWWAAREVAV